MVTYTFTNGSVADADQVNQNFDDVESNLQKVIYNDIGGSTQSDTETLLKSISIPAGVIKDNITITLTIANVYYMYYHDDATGNDYYGADKYYTTIKKNTSELLKEFYETQYTETTSHYNERYKTFIVNYSPTNDEKNNGFTIDIYGHLHIPNTTNGADNAKIDVEHILITGR